MPWANCGEVQLPPVELTTLLRDEEETTTLLLLRELELGLTEEDTDDEPSQVPNKRHTAHSVELVAGLSPWVHHLFSYKSPWYDTFCPGAAYSLAGFHASTVPQGLTGVFTVIRTVSEAVMAPSLSMAFTISA